MTCRALAIPVLAAALAAACSSTPTRFHTLVPSAFSSTASASAADRGFLIDVQNVRVPHQVDMPQLVLRESDGEVAVVESRQWIAPLPAEIRDSLSQNLARRLGAIDVHAQGAAGRKLPVVGVRLDVTRFDSLLGREARLDATWTVSRGKEEGAPLRCASAFSQPAASDSFEALVAAHQAALDALAAQIAAAITAAAPTCPP